MAVVFKVVLHIVLARTSARCLTSKLKTQLLGLRSRIRIPFSSEVLDAKNVVIIPFCLAENILTSIYIYETFLPFNKVECSNNSEDIDCGEFAPLIRDESALVASINFDRAATLSALIHSEEEACFIRSYSIHCNTNYNTPKWLTVKPLYKLGIPSNVNMRLVHSQEHSYTRRNPPKPFWSIWSLVSITQSGFVYYCSISKTQFTTIQSTLPHYFDPNLLTHLLRIKRTD
ncbi:uncharacterized protein BDR25DRAFT_348635 [Lindgomyces ingoldianus]|uniref:Uncharacterized protein n=1 Tax=Lindgomyces ingoldianus TaxID=673940 RepID=A0ACB6RGY2_9PLEO|nr:uncharacterized protein BDR25DRAFT_348635 [Lindgomyces ingoldianus]KAF2478376.1 hypothetical protein BDR25DRAFT_348635 [Lindgomyces ingoldianus]